MPQMHKRVISPYIILVAREGTYGDQKRSIAYSLDAEGGDTFFMVARFVI
jgi:hypothetical protein